MKQCPRCDALHDGRRWVPEPADELARAAARGKTRSELCPGCIRVERGQVDGVVTLKGTFLIEHIDEVMNLVERVARNGGRRNVRARVLDTTRTGSEVTITTTDEHLAERIGKEVQRAFKGDLEMKWQEKDHFVRVNWERR